LGRGRGEREEKGEKEKGEEGVKGKGMEVKGKGGEGKEEEVKEGGEGKREILCSCDFSLGKTLVVGSSKHSCLSAIRFDQRIHTRHAKQTRVYDNRKLGVSIPRSEQVCRKTLRTQA